MNDHPIGVCTKIIRLIKHIPAESVKLAFKEYAQDARAKKTWYILKYVKPLCMLARSEQSAVEKKPEKLQTL